MGFIVPNATDTGGGFKWLNINQAEPDSVDFESLGQKDTFIRSGGVVSFVNSTTVSVTAGTAVIGGVVYPFAAPANITCTSVSLQFDLIVARLSGGVVTVQRVSGANVASLTNPTLPKSNNAMVSGASTSTNYNPATDAVLAAVYVPSGGMTNQSNIVDKRVIDLTPVTNSVSGAWSPTPSNNSSYVAGDTVVDSNNIVWVKAAGGNWGQIGPTLGALTSWNPAVTQGAGNISQSSTYARFSNLGRQWYFTFDITLSGAGVSGSPISVAGIPITLQNTGGVGYHSLGSGVVADISDHSTGYNVCAIVPSSGGSIRFVRAGTNDGALPAYVGEVPTFALASGDRLTGTFMFESSVDALTPGGLR